MVGKLRALAALCCKGRPVLAMLCCACSSALWVRDATWLKQALSLTPDYLKAQANTLDYKDWQVRGEQQMLPHVFVHIVAYVYACLCAVRGCATRPYACVKQHRAHVVHVNHPAVSAVLCCAAGAAGPQIPGPQAVVCTADVRC